MFLTFFPDFSLVIADESSGCKAREIPRNQMTHELLQKRNFKNFLYAPNIETNKVTYLQYFFFKAMFSCISSQLENKTFPF